MSESMSPAPLPKSPTTVATLSQPLPAWHPGDVEPDPLLPRHRIFAEEYVSGANTGKRFNAVAAARWAGYTVDNVPNPSQVGHSILKKPTVKKYVDELMEAYSLSAAEVLLRFSEIARSQPGTVVTKNPVTGRLEIDPDAVIALAPYIKSIGYDSNGNPKVDFHDAHQALRDIAKVRGMFKEGLELSGPGGGAVPLAMQVQFVAPNGETMGPVPQKTQPIEVEYTEE